VQVATDRIDAWHSAFEDAGVGLTLAPSHAPPDHADTAISAGALAQILDVALSNACRYAGASSCTQVSVTTTAQQVHIAIADTGPGVGATELDRLTHRFFRGATAEGIGGSGLGLSIAAALATAHHGRLVLEALDPHGLCVRIELPAVVIGR
jgi:signal transduction histidine kinase